MQVEDLHFTTTGRPPIITVTLNPSIDRTLWVNGFAVGRTFLAERTEEFAGGKGVNTARALGRMGVHATASGILCREKSRVYLDILDVEGLEHQFFTTEGRVRTNITIVADRGGKETHIRDRGSAQDPEALALFQSWLKDRLRQAGPGRRSGRGAGAHEGRRDRDRVPDSKKEYEGPLIVLSGSLPEGLPPDTYASLITLIGREGGTAFLDTSGEPLRLGLRARPTFIKPNRREVEESLGFLPRNEEELLRAVETYHGLGVPRVMISLGQDGLLYSDREITVAAQVRVERPINTVGSGDAAVAGAVLGFLAGLGAEETARLACTMGGANTLTPGAGRIDEADVHGLYRTAEVRRL
jgi:1-phosphofructokinase